MDTSIRPLTAKERAFREAIKRDAEEAAMSDSAHTNPLNDASHVLLQGKSEAEAYELRVLWNYFYSNAVAAGEDVCV